jgi:glycosyltransferase involved in cell wall biosynthesis
LENFVVHNRTFCQELSSLDPSLFHDSLTLFPTASECQLLGIFRWLGTFPDARRPKAAICLNAPLEWSKTNHSAGLYKTVWRDCPLAVKDRIAIFCRTPQNAEMFATHIGVPARAFPYPIPEDLVAARQRSTGAPSGPLVISFVGGARRERGGDLLADVVKQCSGLGVQFFIQVTHGRDTDLDDKILTALSGLPYVRLHEGPLERSDYYRAIADSVVLLAYEQKAYRWRDSGVYNEAKFLDAPVLATAGTWMGDEVASLGNGLAIEGRSTASIVDCIAQAQRVLPALRAAAARVGRDARERNGVARCIDSVAGAFASSREMGT